jgi:hypothetical protein
MASLFRPGRRGPVPQRVRATSGRGAHSGGNNFVNAQPAADGVVAGNDLTIRFNQPVALSGTPQIVTDVAGAVAVSAAQSADDTIVVTFDNAVAAATAYTVPLNDAAIRTRSGGWADQGTFPCGV